MATKSTQPENQETDPEPPPSYNTFIKNNLTETQSSAIEAMKSGKNVFVTGPAGVGKSTVLNIFKQHCHESGIQLAICSTTGVSALLIGGSTLHSWSGIKLGTGTVDQLHALILGNSGAKARWRKVKTLVIDEISMLTPELLPKLETLARRMKKNDTVFGGIQVIFSGDFAQLPPINSEKFCFEMPIWNKIVQHTFHLNEIKRQSDPVFQQMLLDIRLGKVTDETIATFKDRIVHKLPKVNGIEPTMLYPINRDVSIKNNAKLKGLKKKFNSVGYSSLFSIVSDSGMVPSRVYSFWKERMIQSCPAPSKLELTIDAQVMILANLDLKGGVANGTRGVVTGLYEDHVIVRLLSGTEIRVDQFKWEIEQDDLVASLTQIPLNLAWSCSIHKTQGSSLDYVAADLGPSVFEYGQAYTALSRVRSLDGLFLTKFKPSRIQAHPRVVKYYAGLDKKVTN